MSEIITPETATASWQKLVQEAGVHCHQSLDEDLESYLVFLLMRYTGRAELADSVLALRYLEGQLASGQQCIQQLQEVGDQCLLFSGLFPQRSQRRLVRISYYVDMGRASYMQLAERLRQSYANLYQRLSEGFVALMDILQAMRILGDGKEPDSLMLMECWQDCGSEQAYRSLEKRFSDSFLCKAEKKRH